METNKKTTGEKKEEEPKKENKSEANDADFDFSKLSGIDFSKILKDVKNNELLKHLLTAAAAMGGNYFFWIKPMQDKMEAMNRQIQKQESLIKELQDDLDKVENELNREKYNQTNKGTNGEFFTYKSNGTHQENNRTTYRHVNL